MTTGTDLTSAVADRLGLGALPADDLEALTAVYRAWCRAVPFDNVRKRIFQAAGATGPVPGATAEEFLADLLAGGTGGTCWSTSLGLTALLRALGFDAAPKAATMMTDPDVRANHCSVVVELGVGRHYVVDSSLLTEVPLAIPEVGAESAVESRLHPVRMRRTAPEHVDVDWLPAHSRGAFVTVRIERDPVTDAQVAAWHDRTRGYSLFNQALYVRRNTATGIDVYGRGRFVEVAADGTTTERRITPAELPALLTGRFGLAPAVVAAIPPDDAGPAFL
jgi:N-hydroxyarylamine O-acetyltransferase